MSEEQAAPLPLLAEPRNPSVVLVDTIDSLVAAAGALAAETGPFALDAERASGFKYSNRAYLVQVSRGNSPIFLIDPVGIVPELDEHSSAERVAAFSELATVLTNDEWILHAATQDLSCLAELGLKPSSLFDTELGGRLAGFERVGLGAMCENLLGYRLAKEHSAVDWSVRPLHADWLNYAALDIDVLYELRTAVAESLRLQKKYEYAAEEFAYLVRWQPRPAKVERWRGMSGLHDVKDQRRLAIARELWTARESLAQKLDVSPGRLVPDSSIVAVVKNTPRTRSELAGRKDFNGRASRTYLDTWWHAVELGSETKNLPAIKLPHTGMPNHRNWANRFPDADARLNRLKPAMASIAELAGMPGENVLTPDFMRQLAWEPPMEVTVESVETALLGFGARSWQAKLCADLFATALLAPPTAETETTSD